MLYISVVTSPSYIDELGNISEVINENSRSAFNYLGDFSCTNVKFCRVLEIPFKVSENYGLVKNFYVVTMAAV